MGGGGGGDGFGLGFQERRRGSSTFLYVSRIFSTILYLIISFESCHNGVVLHVIYKYICILQNLHLAIGQLVINVIIR